MISSVNIRFYLELLKKAAKLDIFDLHYEGSSGKMNSSEIRIAESYKRGVFWRLLAFSWHMFRALMDTLLLKPSHIPPNSIVFWTLSKNETDSLKPITSKMTNAYLVDRTDTINRYLNWFLVFIIAIPYWPFLIINYFRSSDYQKRSYKMALDTYWTIYGLYIVGRLWIRRLRPSIMVFSNLLHSDCRVLQKAAKEEGITCVFVQHASLFDAIPRFTYEYSLLEGQSSLEKASKDCATYTKFFLVGMPKHDAYISFVNDRQTISAIGICTNPMDSMEVVENLLNQLCKEFPRIPMIMRPHNGDRRRDLWLKLSRKYDLEFSDSRSELAFDFLKNVDVIIAGDSNILLEATLMNVMPLYYDFPQKHLDFYGFERNGLVEYFSEPKAICNYIKEIITCKPFIRNRAKYYNATIDTEYDGCSSELVAGLLEMFQPEGKIDFEKWQRIPDIEVEAYELKRGSV